MDLLPSLEMDNVSSGLSTLINSIPNLIDIVGTLPNSVNMDSSMEVNMRDTVAKPMDNGMCGAIHSFCL